MVRNVIIFYGEELLAPRPTPKLEDHPLSAVCDCLFNVFAATLHNWRPFLHPQPEDAPCRGDMDPLNTDLYACLFSKCKAVSNGLFHSCVVSLKVIRNAKITRWK
jgi:hypothetical protein